MSEAATRRESHLHSDLSWSFVLGRSQGRLSDAVGAVPGVHGTKTRTPDSGARAAFTVTKDAVAVDKGAAVDTVKNPWVWYSADGASEQVVSLITCDITAEHIAGHSVTT